jgi:lipopolysaccharide assembly protein A
MNALRIILVTALGVALTLFAVVNWSPVSVNLGFGLILLTHLPILIGALLLLVFVPMWIIQSTGRLLLTRKLTKVQSALDRSEAALAQARVELLRPPAAAASAASTARALDAAIMAAPANAAAVAAPPIAAPRDLPQPIATPLVPPGT